MPAVFSAPLRADLVNFIHTNMAKNIRQPYAVSPKAGGQTSAESWGTGRAVARIPRVKGSGTHRSGQAAFGNMCRGGRMFAPTKVWRKWHRKINSHQKYYATVSAIAASAIPSLLLARGHRVGSVAEVPLVLSASVESAKKTKEAVSWLKAVGAYEDIQKVLDSKKRRTGKSKWRNRTFSMRKGPLVVYGKDEGIVRAFRNIPGVDLAEVGSLDLLELAPGGHMGRFIIWTETAFSQLDAVFGTFTTRSLFEGHHMLPTSVMLNTDLDRILESTEIQSVVRAAKAPASIRTQNFNPLKNAKAMLHLNPYADKMREILEAEELKEKNKPVDEEYLKAEAAIINTITQN